MHAAKDIRIKIPVWDPDVAKLILLSTLLGLVFKLYPTIIFYVYFEHKSVHYVVQESCCPDVFW